MDAERDWLTTAETAALLGLRPSTVKHAIKAGRLRARRITPHLYGIAPDAIEEYRATRLGRKGWAVRRERQQTVSVAGSPMDAQQE